LEIRRVIFVEIRITLPGSAQNPCNLAQLYLARRLLNDQPANSLEGSMHKHRLHGVIVGGIFAALITWVAASDTIAEGGFVLLASVVFGLSAGLCIGGLMAANFFLLAGEEEHKAAAPAEPQIEIRRAA
jgi:hypothetical protein